MGAGLIRPATPADAPEIARLGRKFFDQAGWSELEYNEADCAAYLGRTIGKDHFICFVSGEPIHGMAAGMIGQAYFNASQTIGEELFWWAAAPGAGVRLLAALEGEARARGCVAFQMKNLARLDGARVARLLERRGYRPSESAFIKGL